MMVPDYALIGEISLYSMGFVDARSLAGKIVDTYKLCSEQLSSQHHYDYGMRAVKSVLTAAGNLKLKYPNDDEPMLVLKAINDVNLPKFLAQDIPLFNGIISDLFPGVKLLKPDLDALIATLKTVCESRNLQPTPFFIEKTLQVYEMILVRHGLMVVGEPLGGKTCAYQSLAAALTIIENEKPGGFIENKVVYKIINPKAITMGQLYGQFDPVSHEWSDGVLATAFREQASANNDDRKWIVFDGPVDAVWIENMNTVLDDNKKLCLMSGEIIQMTNQMNMMFEPADLEQASPATVSRCGMIYLEPKQLGWRPLKDSYLKKGIPTTCTPEQVTLINDFFEWIVPPSLEFIRHNCKVFIPTSELHLVQTMIRLYSSILKGESGKDDEANQNTIWLQYSFIFCIVWSLGSTLTQESREKFDVFYRQLLLGNNQESPRPDSFSLSKNQLFPEKGIVFDYICDSRTNQWVGWIDTVDRELLKLDPQANVNELIIPTDETARQTYFLKIYLKNNIPQLFVGPTGTGKSVITLNYLMGLSRDKWLPNAMNFIARTTAGQTQDLIMSKLFRRGKGTYGPPPGKKCILFVDDLSMPQKEIYGAQPPIELLRQWIDHGNWYDKKDTSPIYLIDMIFVGAMGPPGGGRNEVTSRMIRHLSILAIDAFDDNTLRKIFTAIIDWHFSKDYEGEIVRWARQMVVATLQTYKSAMAQFLPTPAKSHYMFNVRDFSRVVRGLLLVPPTHLKEPPKLMRLWVHEVYRVFYDRLVDEKDRVKFFQLMSATTLECFKTDVPKLLGHLGDGKTVTDADMRNLMFGDYMDPKADPRVYDEITELEKISDIMEGYLKEYNSVSKNQMHLVLFEFAIEHISRIARVLKQDSGHALLIGIGGTGRQSLTKLSTFMAGYDVMQIEIGKQYGMNEWKEDMKRLLKLAGNFGKQTVFLFSDNQIKDENFVEDINMILNTGDVPNLFQADEKGEIMEKMQAAAKDLGKKIEASPLALYNFFVDRVKANLHVVLAMSPVGDAFRNRLRIFPSLINCCTVDWLTLWPENALEKVARKSLEGIDIPADLRKGAVSICKFFHMKAETLAKKFEDELGRHVYVTPASYLELILTFKQVIQGKKDEIMNAKLRYLGGLEKLAFAAGEVITFD